MKLIHAALYTFAALSLISATASAQDGSEASAPRTPENAQRFLSEFLGQGRILATARFRLKGGYTPYRQLEDGSFPDLYKSFADTSGRIETWSALGRCRSKVTMADVRTVSDLSPSYGYPAQRVEIEIDWERITAIGSSAQTVPVRVRLSEGDAITELSPWRVGLGIRLSERSLPELLFDTREEAERVAFALEFLRSSCAIKSSTGF